MATLQTLIHKHPRLQIANIEISPRLVICLIFFFAVLAINARIITLIYVILIVWLLTGARQALQAITLSVIIRFLNPAVFAKPPELGVLAWGLALVASVRLISTFSPSSFRTPRHLLAFIVIIASLLGFFLMVTLGSALNSHHFAVSFLKISIFTLMFAAILIGFNSLGRDDVAAFENWLFHLVLTVAFLSIFAFASSGIAYNRTAEGFQGMLTHPQAFGIFLAPVACYLAAQLIFQVKINKPVTALTLACLCVLIILSHSRTAMLSMLLALLFTYCLGIFFIKDTIKSAAKSVFLILLAVIFALPLLFYSYSAIKRSAESLVYKGDAGSVSEAFYHSRGIFIESQLSNFMKHPFLGNGFGVYAAEQVPQRVQTLWGIPVAAPVEKGFLPTAVLEETGLMGTFFLLVFFVAISLRVMNNSNMSYLCIFFSSLFVNLGQMVFFAANGLGPFYWVLIGLSTVKGAHSKDNA